MSVEWMGMVGTIAAAVSFLFQEVRRIRLINSIGCVAFMIYAFLIHSPSVFLLNFIILVIHVVHLVGMQRS